MKRILFLLTMILIGVNVSFASNKKEKKDAENMALYEKAVKAVQDKKFVVKFHTDDGKSYKSDRNVRRRLNSLTNFLMVDGNTTFRQFDDGRRVLGHSHGGGVHFNYPEIKEGTVSEVNVNVDDKGKVTCTLLTKQEGKSDYVVEITFKKGSNECTIKGGRKGNKSTSWGTIHPIGETEIRKAI
ncbi:MAG: DUF4251 domain-containing protein [Bacteroidaceae bacterium]|nr:DUF4251 domain-containing protein [Bacteroidaceae bacterium]